MSGVVNIDDLIASGIHFGHRVRSWNPKMDPFIFRKRNGIHIVDIKETIKGLIRVQRFIEMVVAKGDDVLIVGTKRQASSSVMEVARSVGMPFVSERWLGGTLTNHNTVRQRLTRLDELDDLTTRTDGSGLSKKAIASMIREHRKIHRNLNGIRNMEGMPGALVIIDINREHNAVAEARRMKIPTVALVDTDSNPDLVDIVVPGNDDALKAISIFLEVVASGIRSGLAKRTSATAAAKENAATQSEASQPAAAKEAETVASTATPEAADDNKKES